MSNNVVTMPSQPQQAKAITTNFAPRDFNELVHFSKLAASSALIPKSYNGKAADVMIAIQMGAELGLAPMQSLQNIAVINGKPSLYGDAMLAICKASPLCEYVEEEITGNNENDWVAICKVKRKGDRKELVQSFTMIDAKNAGLKDKGGPWKNYPKRMLQMRARGFALRDAFPDLLNGLITREEAEDYPTVQQSSNYKNEEHQNTIEATPVHNQEEGIQKFMNNFAFRLEKVHTQAELEQLTSDTQIIKYRARLREIHPEKDEELQNLITYKLKEVNKLDQPNNQEPPAHLFPDEMPDI